MLVAVWIITFCLIIGIGVYAGTKITSSNQWSGGDKTLSALSLGCVFKMATILELPAHGILSQDHFTLYF